MADAAYIPPHIDDLQDLLDDFEMFLHEDTILIPHLIRCAIAHYQFETIHTFFGWEWAYWKALDNNLSRE